MSLIFFAAMSQDRAIFPHTLIELFSQLIYSLILSH